MKLDQIERKLTGGEKRSKEAHYKKLKKHKKDFVDRYGKDDGEAVMHAIATNRAKGESSIHEMDPRFPHTAMTSGFVNWLKGKNLTMKQVADPMTRWNLMKQYQKETGKNIIPLDPMKKEMQEKNKNCGCGKDPCETYGQQTEVYDPEHGHDSDSHVVKHKDDNDQIFFGVYNADGKIVRVFYDEDKAKNWTADNHDDLMNDRYVPMGEEPKEEPIGKKIRPKTAKDDEPKSVEIDEGYKKKKKKKKKYGEALNTWLEENKMYGVMTEAEFDEAAGKKDACYYKVKSRYKVWPSAYASGALVQCRKKGAKNWGNKSKKK